MAKNNKLSTTTIDSIISMLTELKNESAGTTVKPSKTITVSRSNPNTKLTKSAVKDIRRSVAKGVSRKTLAAKHGVTVGYISNIVTNRVWKDALV